MVLFKFLHTETRGLYPPLTINGWFCLQSTSVCSELAALDAWLKKKIGVSDHSISIRVRLHTLQSELHTGHL